MPRPPLPPPIADSPARLVALLLALVSVPVVAAAGLFGGATVYPLPLGLLALNVVFLGLIPLHVAYVSSGSFRRGGLVSLLLMGAGMLCIGLGAIAAGTVGLLPAPSNLVITVHNVTVCTGAALQAAAALVAFVGWRVGPAGERRQLGVLAYALVAASVAALGAAVLAGRAPVFFVPGAGPTVLRTLVLVAAIALFVVAAALFLVLSRRRGEEFFLWYALGLGLTAVGLVAVSFYAAFDDLLSWAGRAEQYLGACYLLGAFLLLQRRAAGGGVPAREVLASFFAEAEAGYRELLETAGDAIVVLGPDDRVLLFNAAAECLFGRPRAEAVGMPFADLVPGVLPLPGGGERSPVRREAEARGRDGTVVPVDLTASLRLVEERAVTTCILHDLSERKRAEAALQEYAENLARSNEELQRFAYVASHDLQEPLRSIVSFSQLLERRYRGRLDADADEYIDFIVQGGTRMQALIRDLLQVSRVETQARPPAPTAAAEVVSATLRALEAPLAEAGVTVTVGDLPTVMADAAQLEQVFANLVSNAVKYRREGVEPEVRISAERVNGMWEFAVADNGIGIEEQYFDRIFEMFSRLHTHDRYEGTGIGLAVVKRIVERHGGTSRVESTPGKGSTFYFTLPAA